MYHDSVSTTWYSGELQVRFGCYFFTLYNICMRVRLIVGICRIAINTGRMFFMTGFQYMSLMSSIHSLLCEEPVK